MNQTILGTVEKNPFKNVPQCIKDIFFYFFLILAYNTVTDKRLPYIRYDY